MVWAVSVNYTGSRATITYLSFSIFSPEFLERRSYWTQYLYDLVSVVKMRTIKTNYAVDYAICEKMYSIFRYLTS